MKRTIAFLLLAGFVGIAPMSTQRDDDEPIREKANAITLGPRLGLTFSTLGQPEDVALYDGAAMAFSFGASMKARFGYATQNTREGGTGFWGFGLEALYKQNKVNVVDGNNMQLGYLEVPVTLQVYPMAKSNAMNSFYVEAGPDFALLVSKSPNQLVIPSANLVYHTGDFSGGDIRFIVGLGYTVPHTSLNVNARYYVGTSNLASNFSCKMNSLEISLAWMFNIAKF